ncbi:MAG: zinc ribbon domain-containing protein [Promethearchaeati archaeon SRVP18_Atabeyarchaeia-1]
MGVHIENPRTLVLVRISSYPARMWRGRDKPPMKATAEKPLKSMAAEPMNPEPSENENLQKQGLLKALRTYSLSCNQGEALSGLTSAYNSTLNEMLQRIWGTMQWRKHQIKGKKQQRLYPAYRKDNAFKRGLRDTCLEGWVYAAHWVDSSPKTAFSIMSSWKRNYEKGERRRRCPRAGRLFLRAKQTLLKLEDEKLRVTVKSREFVYIDLSRRYFKLPGSVSSAGIGEPVITPDRIHLPIHVPEEPRKRPAEAVAWDSNMLSMDGYGPETGWVKIDTRRLASVHISAFEKRRSVQRKASKSKKAKSTLTKYGRRERDRAKKRQVEIARVMRSLSGRNGFEELRKERLYSKSRLWNRRVARTDWRGIRRLADGVEVPQQFTSKTCSRCGWTNKDLRRGAAVFECGNCGLRIDRQLNAAINLYLRMEGVPHEKERWDASILQSLFVGGYVLTGAERRGADELVRRLYDAVKPQIYIAYDRYADAYQPMLT